MALKKAIVEPSWEAKYSFSPAVITEGGKTIWLAGHVGFVDDAGASLAGNFDAQARQAFKNLEKTLRSALPALHGHSQGYLREGIPGQHIAHSSCLCDSRDHGRDHSDRGRRFIAIRTPVERGA